MISPNNRDRHRTGKGDVNASGGGGMGGKNNAAWSESKPSGIDGLGPRLTNENRHPSVQVVRGSTNMDLSRGACRKSIVVLAFTRPGIKDSRAMLLYMICLCLEKSSIASHNTSRLQLGIFPRNQVHHVKNMH